MTPFYVLGGVLALWALLVAFLGITRHEFPGGTSGERVVILLSLLLVAGAIGSAVVGAASEAEEKEGGEGHAPEALAVPQSPA